MKKTKLLIFNVLLCIVSFAQSGEEILEMMHKRFSGKWYKNFTFIQETEFYRNDSLLRKEVWYEAMQFPTLFRIDYGDLANRNANIFRNDSVYIFRKDTLRARRLYRNDLLFFSGGIYFYDLNKAKEISKLMGFDLAKSFVGQWQGEKVYVIGASSEGESTNQVWLSKKHFQPMRLITYSNGNKTEVIYEQHIKLGSGWSETKVTFYLNDKLSQIEYYKECKVNVVLDERVFDPSAFGKLHWYK